MARKLKTYQTSLGFFDLAIAVPSMKAALEAWGSKSNLFHQGFANEVEDPKIIAATLRKPGVIFQRPVGSNGAFKEHADLPTNRSLDGAKRRFEKPPAKLKKQPPKKINDKASRRAALRYEKEQRKRESQLRKEKAASAKKGERRQKLIDKAKVAIELAKREYDQRAGKIDAERAALNERSQVEDAHWQKQKGRLENALRRAGLRPLT
jgi:colicin import membrane protein